MKSNKSFVAKQLEEKAKLFDKKNLSYGDTFHTHGKLMEIFQEGTGRFILKNHHDFNRYAIVVQILTKLARYMYNFKKGGHEDSLDDISVYCQILKQLDMEAKSDKEA